MKYDTILFDLDGTLLDTLEDLTDSVNLMLEKEGYPARTSDNIKAYIGNGARELIRKALPEGISEEEISRCLSEYRKIYRRNMFHKTHPYEGITETLQILKRMGVRIGVVSNKPNDATREMCSIYFGDSVDAAIGDNSERRKKPEPDNILEVLSQMGSNRENTLYVGDSEVDVATAKNAVLDCAGVAWGYRPKELLMEMGADYIIVNPLQLIDMIKAEGQ